MSDRWLRWGAPAGLLLASLLHPVADAGDVAGSIGSSLLRWQAVHVAQLLLFPLVALALYRLLPPAASRERQVARAGLAAFAIAAVAFDSMIGLATGVLAALAGGDPVRQAFVQDYWAARLSEPVVGMVYLTTAFGWLAGVGAVAVSLRRAGASLAIVGLLAVSGLLAVDHAAPFGTAAMLGLLGATAAVTIRERRMAVPG
jgi:hypothetical protein